MMLTRFLMWAGLCLSLCGVAMGDFFGSGLNRFEIPFLTIGDPGHPADTTGSPVPAGSVNYVYQIGQFGVPEQAINQAVAQSATSSNPLELELQTERGPMMPATTLTWPDVARFVNWLNTEKGAAPAYKFDGDENFQLWSSGSPNLGTGADPGYDPDNLFRNSNALYFLPSVDEWYKAAYYDPATATYFDFATGTNADPIPVASGTDPGSAVYNQVGPAEVTLSGGISTYGTFGQSGNVAEWEETAFDLTNNSPFDTCGIRGGDWRLTVNANDLSSTFRIQFDLTSRPFDVGFRVARVPEPQNSLIALVSCLASLPMMRQWRVAIRT